MCAEPAKWGLVSRELGMFTSDGPCGMISLVVLVQPGEWSAVAVPVVDEPGDRSDEFGDGVERAATDGLAGDEAEEISTMSVIQDPEVGVTCMVTRGFLGKPGLRPRVPVGGVIVRIPTPPGQGYEACPIRSKSLTKVKATR